jgi:hypothetical protein
MLAGVIGGLAGGVAFGGLMQLTGTLPMVAQLVDRESVLVGWSVHLGIAVLVGVTYALIFGLPALAPSISSVLGVFYGLVWWILGALTLLPMRLGLGLFVLDTAAWQSLAGHAVYGLVLGVVFAVAGQLLSREPAPERQPPAVTGPAPDPHPPAAAGPAPDPRLSARTGLTPLPRHARALRQRRPAPEPGAD